MDDTISIKASGSGLSLTAGLASVSGALPLDAKGRIPSAVRVTALSSAAVHIRTGASNVAATSTGLLLVGGNSIVVDTSGQTHIAVIQAGLSLGGLVNIIPYE